MIKNADVYFNINSEWKNFFYDYLNSNEWKRLIKFIKAEYEEKEIFPKKENIFKAFSYFQPEKTKVVIIGQDPYHTPNFATGLAFSIPNEMRLLPSIRNIYKEIENDLKIKKDFTDGNLEKWAKQGVLLINTILTVKAHKPASHHKKGWEEFTKNLIQKLSDEYEHIVFIAWGNFAKEKVKNVDRSKHLVLESAHPSPFSAHRGFFGNKHFSQTNTYLKKHNKKEINW
jgi:uracil-DNA glycosylase